MNGTPAFRSIPTTFMGLKFDRPGEVGGGETLMGGVRSCCREDSTHSTTAALLYKLYLIH